MVHNYEFSFVTSIFSTEQYFCVIIVIILKEEER